MGSGPCTFKELEITRALKAAKKAGVDVQIKIDLARKMITLIPVKAREENSAEVITPSEELERWRRRKNAG